MVYVGTIALVPASDGVIELAAAPADKPVVDNDVIVYPPLGVEVDVDAEPRVAVVEPRVPAAASVEVAPVAESDVIGRKFVVRVQASYLVQPWLTSPFRFPARYELFAADYGR